MVEEALLSELETFPRADPRLLHTLVPVVNTRIEGEALMVHLEARRRLAVEVGALDQLEEGDLILTKIPGPTLSTISRASSCSRSSTSFSVRSGVRSLLVPCRTWIYAMRRRRARCTSHGRGR